MIPTIQWMSKAFDTYNAKYFGGQLPRPKFKISPLNNEWGEFFIDAKYDRHRRIYGIKNGNGVLILTSKYDRSEKSLTETMLHEMIHEYIYLVNGIWPRNQHGPEFQDIANKINADGWKISEKSEIMDTDKLIQGKYANDESSYVSTICYFNLTSQGVNYWGCKVDPKQINTVISTIKKIGGTSPKFYKCNSEFLYNTESNPNTLWGFGGNTIQEVASKFAMWSNENISLFLPK